MDGIAEVTLTLHPSTPLPTDALRQGNPHLKHAELMQRHGAHPRIQERLAEFAHQHHLRVVTLDPARRIARLCGSKAEITAAFARGTHKTAKVPAALKADVEAVMGLPPDSHVYRNPVPRDLRKRSGRTLQELAEAYDFPSADAKGQTIGVLEFGGGFRSKDIADFCQKSQLPLPRIATESIAGAKNRPAPAAAINELLDAMTDPSKLASLDLASARMQAAVSTLEVTMDVEIVAALAPGARIVVYFAPPDQQFQALHRAIYDERHRPSVLSSSWGQPETGYSPSHLLAVNNLLEVAAHLGITVCVSSGDHGALNDSTDHSPTVNFPASSPFCLTCGGTTTLLGKKADRLTVQRESVWNSTHLKMHGASGGGVSRTFPKPHWQHDAHVPQAPTGHTGRGLPDVAGPADPRFGCDLMIAGRTFSTAGTSAVAPLWAALIARCNAALGRRCGYLNPHLYQLAAARKKVLRPVVKGSNGAYQAGPGWNACTGYGTPIGTDLLRSLQHHSNPR